MSPDPDDNGNESSICHALPEELMRQSGNRISSASKIGQDVMTQSDLVVSNPKVMLGKPTIRGTRITVELILEKLAAGETEAQILEAHPRLTKAAIQAALAFAVQALRSDMVYPVERAS
jgi:uncharacterized protein (DUF433 family)